MNYSWQNIKRRIADIKNPVGAEIGVWQGGLSNRLLENIPGLTLYMIDSWSPQTYTHDKRLHEKFDINTHKNYILSCRVAEKFRDRAHIIPETSADASKLFQNNYFDFVYLDAGHEYEDLKNDIEYWLLKVKRGGWICGHDYPNAPGVKQAVDELFPNAQIDSDMTWFYRM
jgi:hypothetical protein